MYKIIFFFICTSFKANGQVLFLDQLISKLYYTNINIKKTDTIAFVLDQERNVTIGKKMNQTPGFDLIVFDRDNLFTQFLEQKKECYLISIKVLKKTADNMQIRLIFSRTNYEAYTNPNGNIVAEVDDRTITLKINKKLCLLE